MKEGIPNQPKKSAKKRKLKAPTGKAFKNVIAGEVISSVKLEKHIFFILFIILLVIIYIGNGYQAHQLSTSHKKIDKEIKELRAEFVSSQARLIEKMKFINIQEEIEKRGLELEELKTPPYTVSADGY